MVVEPVLVGDKPFQIGIVFLVGLPQPAHGPFVGLGLALGLILFLDFLAGLAFALDAFGPVQGCPGRGHIVGILPAGLFLDEFSNLFERHVIDFFGTRPTQSTGHTVINPRIISLMTFHDHPAFSRLVEVEKNFFPTLFPTFRPNIQVIRGMSIYLRFC